MHSLLIIRAGSTYAKARAMYGNFDSFVLNGFSKKPKEYTVLNAQVQPRYPEVKKLRGIIITGAHENVTDKAAWMLHLQSFILKAHKVGTPLLGICFGHQLIAETLGGKVEYASKSEFGLIQINTKPDCTIFNKQFSDSFFAYASHNQSVITLPKDGKSYAYSKDEQNHIVHFGNKTWGLQFHPEFTHQIMKIYLHANKINGELGNIDEKANAKSNARMVLDAFESYCK